MLSSCKTHFMFAPPDTLPRMGMRWTHPRLEKTEYHVGNHGVSYDLNCNHCCHAGLDPRRVSKGERHQRGSLRPHLALLSEC